MREDIERGPSYCRQDSIANEGLNVSGVSLHTSDVPDLSILAI
jgi:hypothetical protein